MFLPDFFHLFAPRTVGQFRLAVRGHSLLVLDDSGSRIALTEAELLGLEIIAKAGSEGIPPMIGLKVVQPQDRDRDGMDGTGEFGGDDLGLVVLVVWGDVFRLGRCFSFLRTRKWNYESASDALAKRW